MSLNLTRFIYLFSLRKEEKKNTNHSRQSFFCLPALLSPFDFQYLVLMLKVKVNRCFLFVLKIKYAFGLLKKS